jgi:hypothetical protein
MLNRRNDGDVLNDIVELLQNQARSTTHATDAIKSELHDVKESLHKLTVNIFGTDSSDGLISQTRLNARNILEIDARLEASDSKLRDDIAQVKATVDRFTWIGLGLAIAPTVAVLALWYVDVRTSGEPPKVRSPLPSIHQIYRS